MMIILKLLRNTLIKNKERTVYLITEEDAEDITAWIKRNYKNLFESELNDWYLDSELWPSKRTLKVFHEWFEVECHSVILDTVGTKLIDDEV